MVDENMTPTPDQPGTDPLAPEAPEAPVAPEIPMPPASEPVAPPAPPAPEPVMPPAPPAPAAPAAPPAPPAAPQYTPPTPPAAPAAPQYAPPAGPVAGAAEKNKVVAGILGILLGGFGVHKFYLGYTKEGVIMLAGNLLWIVGLGWVPSLIGLIEGIMYLFKSDQEFYATYVAGNKPWF